jgi:3-deoxy-manno-octulosonate cytidylyltransferase (CMP-KDO synthetase)
LKKPIKFHAVIPARWASSRFPGKPLVKIQGREMILHVLDRVQAAAKILKFSSVVVATDDQRIADLVRAHSGDVQMTSAQHLTGTDRIFEVAKLRQWSDDDVVVNIQGDEPLVSQDWILALIQIFIDRPETEMSTLGSDLSLEDLQSKNSVKVLTSQSGRGIYFSRFAIPFSRSEPKLEDLKNGQILKHLGLYAYRVESLKRICQAPAAKIEISESLEQLRALNLDIVIQVQKVTGQSVAIDTPEDLEKIESLLRQNPL